MSKRRGSCPNLRSTPEASGLGFGGGVKSVLGFEVFVFDGFVAKQLGDGVAEVGRRLCHGAVHHEAISMDQLHKLIRAHGRTTTTWSGSLTGPRRHRYRRRDSLGEFYSRSVLHEGFHGFVFGKSQRVVGVRQSSVPPSAFVRIEDRSGARLSFGIRACGSRLFFDPALRVTAALPFQSARVPILASAPGTARPQNLGTTHHPGRSQWLGNAVQAGVWVPGIREITRGKDHVRLNG